MRRSFVEGALRRHGPVVMTAVIFMASLGTEAFALTLSNRHKVERDLFVTEADNRDVSTRLLIQAGQTVGAICKDRCMIVLENGKPRAFDGDENRSSSKSECS